MKRTRPARRVEVASSFKPLTKVVEKYPGVATVGMYQSGIKNSMCFRSRLPSALAARLALRESIATGQDEKEQLARGKSGNIPYPPLVFPPVPSSCIKDIPRQYSRSCYERCRKPFACNGRVIVNVTCLAGCSIDIYSDLQKNDAV